MKRTTLLTLVTVAFSSGLRLTAQPEGTFSRTGDMSVARQSHTATLLFDGKVLISGGSGASAELYDPSIGAFILTGGMIHARVAHRATLLPDGKVLIIGGRNEKAEVSRGEVFDPETGSFAEIRGSVPGVSRGVLLANGKVLLLGLAGAQLYDPVTDTFSVGASYAGKGHAVLQTSTVLPDGRVLVTWCVGESCTSISAELYDSVADAFSATGPVNGGEIWLMASLLLDGKVFFVTNFDSNYIAAPALKYDDRDVVHGDVPLGHDFLQIAVRQRMSGTTARTRG
jgi:hypothetical protein